MKSQNQEIWTAIETFNLSKVEEYLSKGGSPDIYGTINHRGREYQACALEKTMMLSNFEMFKLLLDKGANPDQTSERGAILYLAAERFENWGKKVEPEVANDPRYVNYLLEKGANPNTKHKQDEILSVILRARYSRKEYDNSLKLIEMLLEKGADPSIKYSGYTPLGRAYREEDVPLVKLFIKYKANTEGFKDICWGGECSSLEMFKIFLSNSVGGLKLDKEASQGFNDWFEIHKIMQEALLLPNTQEQKKLFQKPENLKIFKKVKAEDLQEFYNFCSDLITSNLGEEAIRSGQKLDFKKEILNTCELHFNLETFMSILSHPNIKFTLLENSPEIFKKLFELKAFLEKICLAGLEKDGIISFINHLSEESSWEEIGKKECTEFCVNYVNNFFSSGSEPFLSEVELLSLGLTSEYNDYSGV